HTHAVLKHTEISNSTAEKYNQINLLAHRAARQAKLSLVCSVVGAHTCERSTTRISILSRLFFVILLLLLICRLLSPLLHNSLKVFQCHIRRPLPSSHIALLSSPIKLACSLLPLKHDAKRCQKQITILLSIFRAHTLFSTLFSPLLDANLASL